MFETLYNVSQYLGIVGFLAFIYSYLSGMRIIKVKAKYKLHKRIGIVGFFAMMVHGLVMLYFHYFS